MPRRVEVGFYQVDEADHRADLAGNYRMVVELRIDEAALPTDAHFFRIEGCQVALIVSGAVKAAMVSVGCVGARFEEVSA